MSYLFPLSFMFNTFATTAFLIGLSLAKQSQMAADVGIVQGATLALFYAFSANARNMILNSSSRVSTRAILVARLLLLAPLGILSFYLSVHVAEAEVLLALALIIRRCVEWVGELHLSEMELRGRREFARKFNIFQFFLLFLSLGWMLSDAPVPLLGLFLWALAPLLMSLGFIRGHLNAVAKLEASWPQMVPHLGSTAIIGITVFVFRLLIMLIVGKVTAGDLYAAFAIGSVLGSIFTNALGPSLIFQEVRNGKQSFPATLKLSMFLWFVAGLAIFLAAKFSVGALGWMEKSDLFWGAVGLSMIGGVVMVFAQRIRLRLLQSHGDGDVFGPDVIMNILIVASVPYLYYLVGPNALMTLYLLSSVLALLFYLSSERRIALGDQRLGLSANVLRRLIALLLFFPLFFQLTGNIFHDSSFVFDSEGALKRLPIPLSVFACYGGILLLGSYKRAYLSFGFIFLSSILMLMASVVSTHGQIAEQQGKLLLLLQFVLPMFALVLGQTYEGSSSNTLIFEKVVLYILSMLVPIQLVLSWLQGHTMLSPYLYLFSIYQHLQYVAVIFICGYLLSLYSLWTVPQFKMLFILLTPLIGIYAVASVSLLAFIAMIVGVLGFAIHRWWLRSDKLPMFIVLLSLLGSACYVPAVLSPSVRDSHMFPQKFAFLGAELGPKELQLRQEFTEGAELTPAELQLREELAQTPVAKRLHFWEYYAKSIVNGSNVFLFGHAERPDRSKSPSAHNYYLDFVYNFGALAFLPMGVAIGYTVLMAYRSQEKILVSPGLLGLTVVVLFLLLVDNSLKVGLRQPYPGIITFFLWGLLLTRIKSLRAADERRLPAAHTINPEGFDCRVRKHRNKLSRKSIYAF